MLWSVMIHFFFFFPLFYDEINEPLLEVRISFISHIAKK